MSEGYRLDRRSVTRLTQIVRQDQRAPKGSIQSPTPPRPLSMAKVVLTTSPIKPGSGDTPGTGTANLQVFNGTKFVPMVGNGTTGITIYNLTEATIISGAYVQVIPIDGYYFYDVTACKNGS